MEYPDRNSLQEILQSEAGKEIKTMLSRLDPAVLQQAATAAKAGNEAQVKALLEPLLRQRGMH